MGAGRIAIVVESRPIGAEGAERARELSSDDHAALFGHQRDRDAVGTFTHIYVDDRGKPCRMDEGVRTALEPLVPDDGL